MNSNSEDGIPQNFEISSTATASLSAANDVEEIRVLPSGAYSGTTLLIAIELTNGLAALVTRKRFVATTPAEIE